MLKRLIIFDYDFSKFREIFNKVKSCTGTERILIQLENNIIIMYFEYSGELDDLTVNLKENIMSFCNFIFLDKFIEGNNYSVIHVDSVQHFYDSSPNVIDEIEAFLAFYDSDVVDFGNQFDGDFEFPLSNDDLGYSNIEQSNTPTVDDILEKISVSGIESLTESDMLILRSLNN